MGNIFKKNTFSDDIYNMMFTLLIEFKDIAISFYLHI